MQKLERNATPGRGSEISFQSNL